MSAENYVTTRRVSVELRPEIRALDGKSIVIIDSERREVRANIRLVFESDPSSSDTRKCAVLVWRSHADETQWGDGAESPRPTIPTEHRQRFLTHDALRLICPNEEDPTQGELVLVLPVALQCLV